MLCGESLNRTAILSRTLGLFWEGVADKTSVYAAIVAMPSAQNLSVRSAQNKHADGVWLEWYLADVIVTLLKKNALVFNVSLFRFGCSCLFCTGG